MDSSEALNSKQDGSTSSSFQPSPAFQYLHNLEGCLQSPEAKSDSTGTAIISSLVESSMLSKKMKYKVIRKPAAGSHDAKFSVSLINEENPSKFASRFASRFTSVTSHYEGAFPSSGDWSLTPSGFYIVTNGRRFYDGAAYPISPPRSRETTNLNVVPSPESKDKVNDDGGDAYDHE